LRLQGINSKNKYKIVIGIIIISAASVVVFFSYLYATQTTFKPTEIYPTKQGGREWYLDGNNPLEDEIFDLDTKITKVQDGSWLVGKDDDSNGDYHVRMNVITPPGQDEWKNVEITGYVKVIDTASGDAASAEGSPTPISAIDWYARGGRHSDSVPCEGTSLKGILRINGLAAWQKEIWHTGGYTDNRAVVKATNPILDRWIGWKVVIYNINNDKDVKMESYIDENANNNWRKVNELVDNGGWYANSPDSVFYSVDCNRSKDYIVTNSGPIVTFRSDNIVWQFKELSVREIVAR
jgi:hypothetical protein